MTHVHLEISLTNEIDFVCEYGRTSCVCSMSMVSLNFDLNIYLHGDNTNDYWMQDIFLSFLCIWVYLLKERIWNSAVNGINVVLMWCNRRFDDTCDEFVKFSAWFYFEKTKWQNVWKWDEWNKVFANNVSWWLNLPLIDLLETISFVIEYLKGDTAGRVRSEIRAQGFIPFFGPRNLAGK